MWEWNDGQFPSCLRSRCLSSHDKRGLKASEALQQARCLLPCSWQTPLLAVNVLRPPWEGAEPLRAPSMGAVEFSSFHLPWPEEEPFPCWFNPCLVPQACPKLRYLNCSQKDDRTRLRGSREKGNPLLLRRGSKGILLLGKPCFSSFNEQIRDRSCWCPSRGWKCKQSQLWEVGIQKGFQKEIACCFAER